MGNECDSCAYYAYDEELEDYFCTVDMDEDEVARMMQQEVQGRRNRCRFWVNGDEYAVVKHQAF